MDNLPIPSQLDPLSRIGHDETQRHDPNRQATKQRKRLPSTAPPPDEPAPALSDFDVTPHELDENV